MKKLISITICLILFIGTLVLPVPVSAAEDSEYNSYYIQCLNSDFKHGSQENTYIGNLYESYFSIDKKLAGVFHKTDKGCEIRIYLFDSSQIYLNGEYNTFGYVKDYADAKDIKGYYKYGNYSIENGNAVWSYVSIEKEYSDSFGAVFSWVTEDINDSGYLHTNIPYFASEEECLAYISGEITEKKAINYETDLTDIVYDLEVPQNMKLELAGNYILFTDYKYSMTWEQTDPNYKNWNTEVYVYVSIDAWKGFLGIKFGDTYTYEDMFLMSDSFSTYKLKYSIHVGSDKYEKAIEKLEKSIFDSNPDVSGTAVDYYKIYMRNFYFDGTKRHYSNWLLVEFDQEFENGQGSTSIIEMNGSEEDNPGTSNPKDDFIGDVNSESQYDGSVDANLTNSGDIIDYIKNGFGVGGDNGVVAIIGDTFDFIPDEIWSVMLTGIALMVAVAVFKFIRG